MFQMKIIPKFKIKEVSMRSRLPKDVRRMVSVCVMLVMGLVLANDPAPVKGQEAKFPSRPIDITVTNAHGGPIDLASRIVAEFVSKELGVPIVVTPRPGGGGLNASAAFVANTKPDGYTLLAAPGDAIIPTVLLSKTPPFDPRKDLLPVGCMGETGIGMYVLGKSPFKTFNDFLQFAKSNPGKLIGGYTAPGSVLHLMYNAILVDTRIEVKSVPYVEGGPLKTAFLGGHVDWITMATSSGKPMVKSGDWRLLLLTRKTAEYPDISAGPEVGLPNFSGNIWIGWFVLPQTPKAVYDRLVAAMKKAVEDPETAKKLDAYGVFPAYKNPREVSDLINREWEVYSHIIKATNMKVN
jgi:tripartite-type tricarboxylate transporter receptor subunit TctC